MEQRVDDEVVYYYDFTPTEEDLMGETSFHSDLITYLILVLRWLFRDRVCAMYENLNFYQTANPREYPLAPDIAVIKGVPLRDLRSWRVGRTGPAPQIVFEVLSAETWNKDLQEKPHRYAQMGVQEYFAYDPHVPPLAADTAQRLFGWQLDPSQHQMKEMLLTPGHRLWSTQLDSLLVPQGKYLRLYDQYGNQRLTEAEAEARRAKALAEKLRSLGVDPDQI